MSVEPREASGEPRSSAVRFRLDLAYDGAGFSGWARQPRLRTVQGVVEDALAKLFSGTCEPAPAVVVAGRTDSGVHAAGQVAHVDLVGAQLAQLRRVRMPRPEVSASAAAAAVEAHAVLGPRLALRLGGVLAADDDLLVRRASVAAPGFDARFSAVWRRYEYRIVDRPEARDPLQRGRTVWHANALDVGAMNAAAETLIGLHDFASYCKPREGATTIRTLQAFEWARDDTETIIARLQADAFCHSMVRALVGACVAVGEGRLEVRDLVSLRDARERTSAFKVMAAKGLTLVEVGYPPDAELAERAVLTRARRSATDDDS